MSGDSGRSVLITGIGLVTSLADGREGHRTALWGAGGPKPVVERERFHPYPVHPLVTVDLDSQIPRRGDQRQMEPWQRTGVYAAGLALDDAGLKGEEALLERTDMIVAAGGGERDPEVDNTLLSEILDKDEIGHALNERLSNDLRPTLFLAQLPNLLAGNISIVHKVAGSSRTFMGEEAAGVDAVRTAHARIAAGQSEVCLVGGAYNAERFDMLLLFELGGYLWRDDWRPIWARQDAGGGLICGSMGAFLVLESDEHAAARGKAPLARLAGVRADRCRRQPGEAAAGAKVQLESLLADRPQGALAILSGVTGAAPATEEERAFLTGLKDGDNDVAVRAAGSLIGHGLEAQFPALVALASLVAAEGRLWPALDDTGFEADPAGTVGGALVTQWGHWRGEGMALVLPAG